MNKKTNTEAKEVEVKEAEKVETKDIKTCGIVMPISAIDGCDDNHWQEVLSIITDSIQDAGFNGSLVSDADEVGMIHKHIVQNLYDNPIVVCDVSCKNPNVMFELGLRLAFDKPTIIIKDDKTTYSFDTSAIEHIPYPRDLHYHQINVFKKKLTEKIKATHEKAKSDENYSPFLKHFREIKVAKIEQEEVSGQEFIIQELKNIRREILSSNRYLQKNYNINSEKRRIEDVGFPVHSNTQQIKIHFEKSELTDEFLNWLRSHPSIIDFFIQENDKDDVILIIIPFKGDKNLLIGEIFAKFDNFDSNNKK